MADAKITLTAEGAQAMQDAFAKIVSAARDAGAAIKDTGDKSKDAGDKTSAFTKYIDELTPSTKNANAAFGEIKGTLSGMWESPTSAVQGLAGALGSDLLGSIGSVGIAAGIAGGVLLATGVGLFEMAEHAAAAGAKLNDLSDTTGMSVPALSRFTQAAAVAGGSVDQISAAMFKFQNQMGNDSQKVSDGLEKIGLKFSDIKNMAPEDQFTTIAGALTAVEDPLQRNAAGADIFGKQFRDMAPFIVKMNEALEMTADIKPFSEDEAKQAEQFDMMIASMKVHFEAFGMAIARDVLPFVSTFIEYSVAIVSHGAEIIGWMTGIIPIAHELGNAIGFAGAALDDMRGKTAELPKVTGPATAGVKNLDDATKAYTNSVIAGSISKQDETRVTKELTDALKTHNAEVEKYAKEWQANEDAIEKAWRDAALAETETDKKTLTGQLATLAQKRKNEEDAAATKIAETTKSADQLDQLVAAIDAKYLALAHTATMDAVKKVEDDKSVYSLEAIEKLGVAQQGANKAQLDLAVKNNTDLIAANRGYNDEIAKETLSSFDQQRRAIDQHLADQKKALEQGGGDWAATFALMQQTANKELDAIAWDEVQSRIDETDAATEQWVEHSKQLFGQLGDAISQVAGVNLTGLMNAFSGTGAGTSLGGMLQGLQPTSAYGKLAGAGISAGAGILANATADATTKGGQVAHYAASGASIGNSIVPVAGGIVGAGIGAIVGAFKVSPEEIAARTELENFEKQFGTLQQTIDAVGVSYASVGKTGVQAQHDLQAALDASHDSADAEDKALVTINAVLVEAQQKTANVKAAVDDVTKAGQAFGGVVPDQFKDAIRQLAAMKDITGDEKDALLSLTADVKPNFEQLTATAQNYGISLANLGPTFEQANIDGTAKQIFQDFSDLKGAGADVGGVLSGMGDDISTLVDQSVQFGVAIPDNMKPLIDELLKSGQLMDANGNKMTDIGKIKFEATPLDQGLASLQGALDRLTNTLQNLPGLAANAANGIGNALNNVDVHTEIDGAATGGWVTSTGIQHFSRGGFVGGPRGSDTVPVWLTPGELVLNQQQQRSMSNSGGTINVTIPVKLDGREIARVTVPLIPAELKRQGVIR